MQNGVAANVFWASNPTWQSFEFVAWAQDNFNYWLLWFIEGMVHVKGSGVRIQVMWQQHCSSSKWISSPHSAHATQQQSCLFTLTKKDTMVTIVFHKKWLHLCGNFGFSITVIKKASWAAWNQVQSHLLLADNMVTIEIFLMDSQNIKKRK